MRSAAINAKTKISELIKANPRTIATLAEFNSNFNKLKNPILRNLLARRVSISDACRIGRCELTEFLAKMASIGFEIEGSEEIMPPVESDMMTASQFTAGLSVVELDVRPILAGGGDPLNLILDKSRGLKTGECLKIINTFEPLPLVKLFSKRGFRSWTERPGIDTVLTWFVKGEDINARPEPPIEISGDHEFQNQMAAFPAEKLQTVDVRDLAMPLPMITILEYLSRLGPDEALFVYHKKIPVYLLPELAERGFRYFIQHSADGDVNMFICR
ncbi:DUF2249 domain-containing protein [Daejeonella sp.]|uniref:DUF2249 domain-containing protein n=1 Tax=Daejeonella sp. TaxID=2805397 RepID=UPI0030BCA01A